MNLISRTGDVGKDWQLLEHNLNTGFSAFTRRRPSSSIGMVLQEYKEIHLLTGTWGQN